MGFFRYRRAFTPICMTWILAISTISLTFLPVDRRPDFNSLQFDLTSAFTNTRGACGRDLLPKCTFRRLHRLTMRHGPNIRLVIIYSTMIRQRRASGLLSFVITNASRTLPVN